MSSAKRFVAALVTGCAIFLAFPAVSSAYSLTGIPPQGFPAFFNDVRINLNTNSGKLLITNPGSVGGGRDFTYDMNGGGLHAGTKLKYTLNADFLSDGTLLGGNVAIEGAIASLGIAEGSVLFTADITAWNLTEDPFLWGFRTENLVCNPLLLTVCTPAESIYVVLDSAFNGDFANGLFKTTGFAVTTVPVPAAAWLFGSALGLLGWMRVRTRKAAA